MSFVLPPHEMKRGDAAAAIARAPHRLKGAFVHRRAGPFLPGRPGRLAVAGEDGDMPVHSSTQHPTEVQHNVAQVLGRADNAVTVECGAWAAASAARRASRR